MKCIEGDLLTFLIRSGWGLMSLLFWLHRQRLGDTVSERVIFVGVWVILREGEDPGRRVVVVHFSKTITN